MKTGQYNSSRPNCTAFVAVAGNLRKYNTSLISFGHQQSTAIKFPYRNQLSLVLTCQYLALFSVASESNFGVGVSDKGGEFVVIPRQLDADITEEHLEDASLYRASTEKEFRNQNRKLNNEWVEMASAAGLKPADISHLEIEVPTCPVLHLLIKTHKLISANELASADPSTFKVRPNFSCVDGLRIELLGL
ncbi:unnamed protein product [Angiostrongylus costaricensis]|uniref:Nucleoplasmin domain-containing protein n=1 Tax=Angiostrongylus costaricensis TaxID=334426 RepID=A0A0R3PS66_ANGCS|nr:unnamed protein product [Angiostrongylus costaricensis]